MKRTGIILLLCAMVLTFASCSSGKNTEKGESINGTDNGTIKYTQVYADNGDTPYDVPKPSTAEQDMQFSFIPESSSSCTESEASRQNTDESIPEIINSQYDEKSREAVLPGIPESTFSEESDKETHSSESDQNDNSSEVSYHSEKPYQNSSSETEKSSAEQSETSNISEESPKPGENSSAEPESSTKVQAGYASFTISWDKVKGADGYIVQYWERGKYPEEQTNVIGTTDTELTVKGLKAGTVYYVRFSSYHIERSSKIYSEWSKVMPVKIKKPVTIDGVTYIDDIIIVNKTYNLPRDYGNGLTDETVSAFNEMTSAAAKDGISLWIKSGFRSYDTQDFTYHFFVNDRGVELADLASARPGHSEHQTGLAIDVNSTSDLFAGTPEAIWLEKNCFKFGFIIRYPKDKTAVTGYKYEPWHIRYIGKSKAEEITRSGLTLEEYYGLTSVYG